MTDYEEMYHRFTWNIPEQFNFGFDIVDKWAEEPDKLALVSVDNSGDNSQDTPSVNYLCFRTS